MKTLNRAELTVAYNDGSILVLDHVCIVDTVDKGVRDIQEGHKRRVIDLRMMVPENIGEETLMALRTGQVAIEVAGAKTVLERCL